MYLGGQYRAKRTHDNALRDLDAHPLINQKCFFFSMRRSLPTQRKLTPEEAAVVERTLAVAAKDAAAPQFAKLVQALQVVGRCDCGCASVNFLYLAEGQIPRIVADATATSESGDNLGVMIWAHGDRLVGLEVYGHGNAPAPLPRLDSIAANDGTSGAA